MSTHMFKIGDICQITKCYTFDVIVGCNIGDLCRINRYAFNNEDFWCWFPQLDKEVIMSSKQLELVAADPSGSVIDLLNI